jgi:hypothetical protein
LAFVFDDGDHLDAGADSFPETVGSAKDADSRNRHSPVVASPRARPNPCRHVSFAVMLRRVLLT